MRTKREKRICLVFGWGGSTFQSNSTLGNAYTNLLALLLEKCFQRPRLCQIRLVRPSERDGVKVPHTHDSFLLFQQGKNSDLHLLAVYGLLSFIVRFFLLFRYDTTV